MTTSATTRALIFLAPILMGAGCQSKARAPTPGRWTSVDAASPRSDAREAGAHDALGFDAVGSGSDGTDAAHRDARRDAGALDGPARDVRAEAGAHDGRARDGGAHDARAREGGGHDASIDLGGRDGEAVDDRCSSNADCTTGFCADGACCATACPNACHSCALPGTIGTCVAVSAGVANPHGVCPRGTACGTDAGCVPLTCVTDWDCGDAALCAGGTCHSCEATCVSNADCIVYSVCICRNSCTYCGRADAATSL